MSLSSFTQQTFFFLLTKSRPHHFNTNNDDSQAKYTSTTAPTNFSHFPNKLVGGYLAIFGGGVVPGFPTPSPRSGRLEVVGTRKNGRARRHARGEVAHPSRVSLARARSLFRPLLPSACYAGYQTPDAISDQNTHFPPASFQTWPVKSIFPYFQTWLLKSCTRFGNLSLRPSEVNTDMAFTNIFIIFNQ